MFPWNFMPFDPQSQKKFMEMKPDEIEKYIQQMMGMMLNPKMQEKIRPEDWLKKMKQGTAEAMPPSQKLESDVLETHDFVFVRLRIVEEEWLKQMKIFYTSNQVLIENLPESGDKHTLILPATVKRKGASAAFKDGILELKLPKRMEIQYSEIDFS